MKEIPSRWEHGSEFHLFSYDQQNSISIPWSDSGQLFGSGRYAFRALLQHGVATRGWRRLWMPSYFCPPVVTAALSTGIKVAIYDDGPENIQPDFKLLDFRKGDVLHLSNYFGLRTKYSALNIDRSLIEVIENHTHDPWSTWARTSNADWCIASLRKTLPIPDGGIVWTPKGHQLPEAAPVSDLHQSASLEKLAAMVLKNLYLEGKQIDKEVFRRMAVSSENLLAAGEISGIPDWTANMLGTFPVEEWRQQRRRNHRVLVNALANVSWLSVLMPADGADVTPFAGILIFDNAARCRHIRQALAASHIYTAVHWSLDEPVIKGIQQKHIDLSSRLFSVHCDMRYIDADMEYVASLIYKFGEEYCEGGSAS
ncbi:MAG: hypothetical protein KGZ93_06755 [Actinobacteria bacterium]|nr:hypothetical protein [Actinomycetota bacterium]